MYGTFIPNQDEHFNEFYKKIKHHKLTTAILQKFFFGNIKCENILDCIPELEKLCNEHVYDNKNNLYT
jgi:hypothetical protein